MPKRKFDDNPQDLKTQGAWTWNDRLLWAKVQPGCEDQCWSWTGSKGPHANLFGGRKNNHPQMSQAPRFLWMSIHGQDITDLEIRHTCHNRWCCNPNHLIAENNHMKRPPRIKPKTIQAQAVTRPAATASNKRQWWEL